MKQKLLKWIYILLLLFPCFEVALRIVGGEPYINDAYKVEITPENAFIGDDSLGIALNPGIYRIKLNDNIEFSAKHSLIGCREVMGNDSENDSNQIVSLGCSFTYGYGVNDAENFTSLLQGKFPTYKFINQGVPGYGTIQSYLQLKKMITNGIVPEVVLLNFSSYHLDRNALTPYYRRALKIGFSQSMKSINELMKNARFPYSRAENGVEMEFQSWNELYQDWRGRRYFASVNYLQTAWDRIKTEKLNLQSISLSILKEMNRLCIENDCEFIVSILDNQIITGLNAKLNKENISTIEVNFNFADSTITNLPFDMHPNSKGHDYIANKIHESLNPMLKK